MTDHITLPRSVVEQAIYALAFGLDGGAQKSDAIEALRAALAAQQPGPKQHNTFEGEGWETLAWHLCAEEHGEDACNDLLWEGGPTPEPWGDRWMKYESDAKRMIDLVQKYTAPQPAQPVAVPKGWVMPTEAEIDEYIEDYEMRGDGSDYRPTEQERFVIKDAIMGLLAESFKGHATTPPAATVPVLEPLTDAEIAEPFKPFRTSASRAFIEGVRFAEAAHAAKLAKRGGV